MLVVTVVTKELEYRGPGIKENRNAIDEYYPQNTVAQKNGSIVKAVGTCEHKSILVPDLPEFTAQDACKTSTSRQTKKQRSQYQPGLPVTPNRNV